MADRCATDGASTCSPPSGLPFFNNKLLAQIAPFAVPIPLANLLLFPLLWRAAGLFLGWYLRNKTDGRRCHIVELVEADEKKYREGRRNSTGSGDVGEDGGWEKVDAVTAGIPENGDKKDAEWDGIVGFFHPFW